MLIVLYINSSDISCSAKESSKFTLRSCGFKTMTGGVTKEKIYLVKHMIYINIYLQINSVRNQQIIQKLKYIATCISNN